MVPQFMSICLNPVIQKTVVLSQLTENQVNRSNEYYTDASGKGVNVSRVLTQLGEQVVHLTQLGGRFRDYFLSLTDSDKLTIEWGESFSEIRSCYTLLNKAHKSSTEIVEEAQPVEAGTGARIMELFKTLLPNFDALIISGTKAAGFSDRIFPEMVQLAKARSKIVVLDYRGRDLLNSLRYRPDIIKPNFLEFVTTFFPGNAETETRMLNLVRDKMLELYQEFQIITILTRGSHEILYVDAGKVKSVYPPKITPVNTIGCGDAFTAGFTAHWIRDRELEPAIQHGMECARKNALLLRPGVVF